MHVELNGQTLAEARLAAWRFLEATHPSDARPYDAPAAVLRLAHARSRAKVAGTKTIRAAIDALLDRLDDGFAANARARDRAKESVREASGDGDAMTRAIVGDLLPDDVLVLAFGDDLAQLFTDGLASAKTELKLGFDVQPKNALNALRDIEFEFSRQFAQRKKAQIKALVTQSLAEGWSTDDLVRAIVDGGLARAMRITNDEGKVVRTISAEAWAEMVARTESSRAYNAGAMATYLAAGVEKIRWVAAEDERTCFPETTRVTVNGQEVPISTLTTKVDTPNGTRNIIARSKRQHTGDWVILEAAGRAVLATSDHPFWASSQWRPAWSLKVGDTLQTHTHKLVEIDRIAYIALGYSNDREAHAPHEVVAFAVASRDSRETVPVVAVNLNDNVLRYEKVDVPSTDFALTEREKTQPAEAFRNQSLGSSFDGACQVATLRAVSTRSAGASLPNLSTIAAGDQVNGASASLGTISAITAARAGKPFSAATARDIAGACESASHGTDGVPVNGRRWNGEQLATLDASFLDIIDEPLTRATVWLSRARNEATFHAAKSSWTGQVRGGCLNSAMLAISDPRHDPILADLGVKTPIVYNLQVEADKVFFAESFLVHNCPLCMMLDGLSTKPGEPFGGADGPINSPAHVLCRCATVADWSFLTK